MAEALAGEWVLILRPHPVERYKVPQHLRHFVRPAGWYPEINDLMLASDALLTDYSSLMCDYAITGRPMLFLIDDWDEYRSGGAGGLLRPARDRPRPLPDHHRGTDPRAERPGRRGRVVRREVRRVSQDVVLGREGERRGEVVDAFFEPTKAQVPVQVWPPVTTRRPIRLPLLEWPW